jgi:muramidase (phage lysozyme)
MRFLPRPTLSNQQKTKKTMVIARFAQEAGKADMTGQLAQIVEAAGRYEMFKAYRQSLAIHYKNYNHPPEGKTMNNKNRVAFLTMIATSEGTENIGGQQGYNVNVGGDLFHDYSTHPNHKEWIKSIGCFSTAAGRYQILYHYWLAYKTQLNLPDFSPKSQDLIAIQLIKECHALDDVDAGRFAIAVDKCKSRWASLPGANYSQHENKLAELEIAYVNAGGTITT